MTSLSEYFQTADLQDVLTSEDITVTNDVTCEEIIDTVIPDLTETEKPNQSNNVRNNSSNDLIVDNTQESTDNYCNVTSGAMSNSVAQQKAASHSVNNSVDSRIGPFADYRPICGCEVVQELTSRTEARFLLSLLNDMSQMNPIQKRIFKQKIVDLISEVDSFELTEDR